LDSCSLEDTGVLGSKLQAAVPLACWAEGFAGIEAAQALAEARTTPEVHRFVVIDELRRVLQAAKGMVARVDALTRLNRTRGVGQALITHTLADMLAGGDREDRRRAVGFAERAGYMVLGGLPAREIPMLTQVFQLTRAEAALLADWSAPSSWNPKTGAEEKLAGLGKFLVKVVDEPGIPLEVELTPSELALHDTNARWKEAMGR
jgi:hypothetical protein